VLIEIKNCSRERKKRERKNALNAAIAEAACAGMLCLDVYDHGIGSK
jgi:hypothetical protein